MRKFYDFYSKKILYRELITYAQDAYTRLLVLMTELD